MRPYKIKYQFSDGSRHLMEVQWLDVPQDSDKSIKYSWFCNLSFGPMKPLSFHFMDDETRVFHECMVVISPDGSTAKLFMERDQVATLIATLMAAQTRPADIEGATHEQ